MKRAPLLILAAALVLGSACTGTYASEETTATTRDENGWSLDDITTMRRSLHSHSYFAGLDFLTQECIVGGILTEFTPDQVRDDIGTSGWKIQGITRTCL
jgi:hypothetical protein